MLAISMFRDESDVLRDSVELLLKQGCRVVVADNLSTDGSAETLAGLDVTIVQDLDPAYHQDRKMTALAAAHAQEGEWVIPFDADERWYGVEQLTGMYDIAIARPHVHIGDRRLPGCEPHPKVAFRWNPGCFILMGNHDVSGAGTRMFEGLEVCHHQYRTLEQVKRKVRQGVAAYNLTGMGASSGTHWRDLAALTDDQLEQWWDEYRGQETIPCRL